MPGRNLSLCSRSECDLGSDAGTLDIASGSHISSGTLQGDRTVASSRELWRKDYIDRARVTGIIGMTCYTSSRWLRG